MSNQTAENCVVGGENMANSVLIVIFGVFLIPCFCAPSALCVPFCKVDFSEEEKKNKNEPSTGTELAFPLDEDLIRLESANGADSWTYGRPSAHTLRTGVAYAKHNKRTASIRNRIYAVPRDFSKEAELWAGRRKGVGGGEQGLALRIMKQMLAYKTMQELAGVMTEFRCNFALAHGDTSLLEARDAGLSFQDFEAAENADPSKEKSKKKPKKPPPSHEELEQLMAKRLELAKLRQLNRKSAAGGGGGVAPTSTEFHDPRTQNVLGINIAHAVDKDNRAGLMSPVGAERDAWSLSSNQEAYVATDDTANKWGPAQTEAPR